MSKCAIIVSGGTLDEALAFETLREYEEPCVIGVDRGVEFLYHHKIRPNYIVGDFDSLPEEIVTYYKERNDVPIREFNPVKDATDTEIAVRDHSGGDRWKTGSFLGKCTDSYDFT